ncbi:hypothetical protein A0J61_11004 [Choanephora cucurbitarum]|uniref:Uncharacterized protein n=1 Tax=Choanephora cucurbitarum TaxID=101091 RepID=A0A1C7MVY4_9FUNG|nr:hypothetical protein A0J61_11004 [Choanephora cucurbitarum]
MTVKIEATRDLSEVSYRCSLSTDCQVKLVRLSSDEPGLSLRSIASSLAFEPGTPKDDIVTMGNRAPPIPFNSIINESIVVSLASTTRLFVLQKT